MESSCNDETGGDRIAPGGTFSASVLLMRHRIGGIAIAVTIVVGYQPPLCAAATIEAAWRTPSRVSSAQASQILLAQVEGEPVAAADLFEAEKHLRTDGGISPSSLVLRDMMTRLLARRAEPAGRELRIRALPPVLHWLESINEPGVLRLRGETVQVGVLNSPPDAAVTVLFHRTLYQEWRLCAGAPCVTAVKMPLRSRVAYLLAARDSAVPASARASELLLATELTGWLQDAEPAAVRLDLAQACDPFPAEAARGRAGSQPMSWFRHAAARTVGDNINEVLCSFRTAGSPASARISYLASGTLATAPSSAARSAVINNPLDFDLYDQSVRR